MTPKVRRRILMAAAYAGFFLVTFFLFAYWTFPYDRVRDYLVQEIERPRDASGQRRPSGWHVNIRELSPSWLTGVALEAVEVSKAPEEPGTEASSMLIDELVARVALLPLIVGDTDVSFDAQLGGGSIDGEIEHSEDATHVAADIDQLNLLRLGILKDLIGIPVAGIATGTVDLTLANELKETQGDVSLEVRNLRIGDGKAKLQMAAMSQGFTVERIDAGDFELQVDVSEGVARIEKMQAQGPDLRLEGSGTIRLLRPLKLSRMDLLLRFKFTDAYRNRSDRTRALFSLMDFNPQMRAARTSDGALQYRLTGSFGSRIHSRAAGNSKAPGG